MNIAWQTTLIKAAAGTGGGQSGKPPRLSADAVFCAIAVAFDNEGMTDAEQIRAFRALQKAGVLNVLAALRLTAEQALRSEIPEGYGPESRSKEWEAGYDAAISAARAAISKAEKGAE